MSPFFFPKKNHWRDSHILTTTFLSVGRNASTQPTGGGWIYPVVVGRAPRRRRPKKIYRRSEGATAGGGNEQEDGARQCTSRSIVFIERSSRLRSGCRSTATRRDPSASREKMHAWLPGRTKESRQQHWRRFNLCARVRHGVVLLASSDGRVCTYARLQCILYTAACGSRGHARRGGVRT